MTASILLLDPYRSALASRGIQEGVLNPPQNVDVNKTSTLLIGKRPSLQATVLQFATLFEEVLIIQHEKRGDPDKYRDRALLLSLIPLQDMGIVRFTEEPGDDKKAEQWGDAKYIEGLWSSEKDDLDVYEPFVIPLLLLKQLIPHESIYRLLREIRLGDEETIMDVFFDVPPEFKEQAAMMVYNPASCLNMDPVVFSTLHELIETERVVSKRQCRVAHMPFSESFLGQGEGPAKEAKKVFKIVIEQLLERKFLFPVPDSLADLQKLRFHPDVKAFRETFQPWLDTLSKGDLEEEKRLRKEVKSAIKRFENSPRAKKINKLLAYIALPAEFVPGAGFLLGVTGLGLDKLAERWQEKGKWVSLCRKSHKVLNLDYPDFESE